MAWFRVKVSRDNLYLQVSFPRCLQSLFVFLAVCTLLLTDQNALRIRRAALLAFGVHTAGTGFMWFKIVRWHVCSAMLYTSLIDHLQDSLFILACTSLAGNAGFGQTVGITLISAVALCCKLMWCRLHHENGRSIEGEPEQSLFKSHLLMSTRRPHCAPDSVS